MGSKRFKVKAQLFVSSRSLLFDHECFLILHESDIILHVLANFIHFVTLTKVKKYHVAVFVNDAFF